MKNFFFRFVVLATFLGPFVVHAENIDTCKMVSAFLEATGNEKVYVDVDQIAFHENEILFLNAMGQWMPTSFVGKDENGLFISDYIPHPRCPKCNKSAPGGICINTKCERCMQY